MTVHSTAAVIGGGAAGMAAAYELKKAGFAVTVFETRDRVGGRIWTVRKGDFVMDLGTAVYLGTYREAVAMIHEVGLTGEFVETPVMFGMPRQGKQHYLDLAKPIRSSVSTQVISWPAKIKALRLFADVFKHRASLGYDTYDGLAEIDTETVLDYSQRVLNTELARYISAPLVSGTWVHDDHDTSVALLHWTVRNMLVKSVFNLTSGVAGLPVKLATLVDTRLEHTVTNVTDSGSAVEVTYTSPAASGERTETFDTVVIATTAAPALSIYPQMDSNHRGLYETARYHRLGNVSLGFSARPDDPGTFSMISPYDDPDTIAVIADHNKAPGRAPAGKGLISVLLSPSYLDRTDDKDDQHLLDHALERVAYYYGSLPGTLEEYALMRWPESVPVLGKGRFKVIADFRKKIDHGARVQFASDLDRIPGLNGALVSGQEAAARVNRLFASRRAVPVK
ncbi:protoporphyrinogen oxidase [Mycolicibacterium sp. BK556]|uniref:protoporphyrinogen/coproporphyrinogen oxidase n=1 Tax=unclassified Mycolicibacterium TaxID=2636767 RepID=UPI001610D883|nr:MULTISPECIES: FAD-dependent oxidoreductase [unclassified Mycolicibacterium]MBB3600599.1 protoporphyrinogen oxidase [Mycolicibacterium sp. BK556]MBB3630352.1 protoporphyrinogen oxidase [Mycolicibacterium sp. BK607]